MDRPNAGFSIDADVKLERAEMALPRQFQRSNSNTLIREFKSFKSSSAPARILFFRNGSWIDFPPAVFDALRREFVAGKTAFELPIAGYSYVFDFLAMSQVDMETGVSNSIAWIDARDRCFFPALAVDERRNLPRFDKGASPAASFECDSAECHREAQISVDSRESSAVVSLDQPRWPGTQALGDGDRYFNVIEKLFVSSLLRFAPNTAITAIHKCSHSGPLAASRLKAFQLQAQMTKAARGDAKIKFGWYGASMTEVAAVVAHGFGQPNNERLGSIARGVGVHLSAPQSPHSTALLAKAGAVPGEERHMMLCRVIMGRAERVEAGSAQYHPSSEEFDSGVDDVANPRWYVVWSTHMNTHILPEFIVSYNSSKQPRSAPPKIGNCGRGPVSHLLFPQLIAEMGGSISSSMTRTLQAIYKQYKVNLVHLFIPLLESASSCALRGWMNSDDFVSNFLFFVCFSCFGNDDREKGLVKTLLLGTSGQ
ncbi:hypothetical protein Cni_G00953 [Canna indica]|uniref:Uncharacterized protein n=1 Tax=Canna indica TaxID=4628 RepID=A0AAQ3JME6_9LILI|nr:hypothetical protein Cni_G00953 [Canna indica]